MYTHLAKGGQLLTATRKRLLASTTVSLYLLAQPEFLPARIASRVSCVPSPSNKVGPVCFGSQSEAVAERSVAPA